MQATFIDQLVADISRRLPPGAGQLGQEIEHNIRAVLKEGIARLDLITREEFDVQQQVLARTRAKLEQLERQVAELEKQTSR
jgi:BMFP domain-containing protein YqiC